MTDRKDTREIARSLVWEAFKLIIKIKLALIALAMVMGASIVLLQHYRNHPKSPPQQMKMPLAIHPRS